MDDFTQPQTRCPKQTVDPFAEWVDYDAHDDALSSPEDLNESSSGDARSTTTTPAGQNTNVDASPSGIYAEWLDAFPSPQQQSAGSGVACGGKRLSDKRREQNRASQRAYRDRQKMLVDGLTTKLRAMSAELEQQKNRCEALEMTCKHLATENDVYRTFLRLEKRPR